MISGITVFSIGKEGKTAFMLGVAKNVSLGQSTEIRRENDA